MARLPPAPSSSPKPPEVLLGRSSQEASSGRRSGTLERRAESLGARGNHVTRR